MATGFEAAGLTLAIFPLVVGGLNAYLDGARTIKGMMSYQITLGNLIRELEMEECKFENTCRFLLEDMFSDSDLKLLVEDPGGPPWSTDDVQEKLKSRLRPATVPRFMEALKALASAVWSLQEKFDLGKPEKDGEKKIKRKLKKMKLAYAKSEYKELLDDIAKINADLETLTGQSKSANPPNRMRASAGHYKRIRNQAINIYEVLKEKLQAAPACVCTVPHHASLRLEVRSIPTAQKARGRDTSLQFHVILSFENAAERSLPWDWREMGLEPLDSEEATWESKQAKEVDNTSDADDKGSSIDISHFATTTKPAVSAPARDDTGGHKGWGNISSPPGSEHRSITPPGWGKRFGLLGREKRPKKTPRHVSFSHTQAGCPDLASITPNTVPRNTTKQIENLCLAIQEAKSDISSLGIVTDERNMRYRVWPHKKTPSTSEPTEVLSLGSLLARSEVLKLRHRLILAVQLASTVMQLHTTEWLSEYWGKGDIFFHQETTDGVSGGAVNISPVIRKTFGRRTSEPPSPFSQTIKDPIRSLLVQHDQSLFSLGVILMELWYGQCLEDLQIETDRKDFGAGGMADYITVKLLSNEISNDAGEKYGCAVRRCINGLDHSDGRLEKDDFKNEVHMKVVCPLVENLEAFCDMAFVDALKRGISVLL